MVISVAEMQQHWGELTQIFLSPDLPATRLLTVWVLVTPTELWVGGGWWVVSKVGCLPRPEAHTPLLPGTSFSSLTAWSFRVSALVSLHLKDIPDTLLRESLCSVF